MVKIVYSLSLLLLVHSTAAISQDFPETVQAEVGNVSPSENRLFGIIAPSDHQFSEFISPMTNPVFFEDPRTVTEARFIFLNHHLPNPLSGDNVQVYATQLRAALTEDLSLIATRDGYIVSQSPILSDGFADVSLGLKYNLFKDPCSQTIVSTGATYELPIGSTRAFQGNGDGEFHLFLSAGTEFLPDWHWITGSGFRLPADTAAENQIWYWSNHLDRKLGNSGLYLFTELNWFHYMTSGSAFPAAVGGQDLFNLGAVNMAGEDLLTAGYGVKYKPNQHVEIGLAYEIPYTSRRDVIADRLTVDLILRY